MRHDQQSPPRPHVAMAYAPPTVNSGPPTVLSAPQSQPMQSAAPLMQQPVPPPTVLSTLPRSEFSSALTRPKAQKDELMASFLPMMA